MQRDDEANQYFRSATDEQLANWLANADKEKHPQYQRALQEQRRRAKERTNQVSEKRHREIRWDNRWLIWLAVLAILVTIAIEVIRNRPDKHSSTSEPASTNAPTPKAQLEPAIPLEPTQSPHSEFLTPAGIELPQKSQVTPIPQSTATPIKFPPPAP